MYELTASEATTILSVLSRGSGVESPESGPHAIPASTFYATRRRIYEAGWLSDRYVPQPWAIGASAVDFVLRTPGPSERTRLESASVASPSTVLLWSGPNAMFSVTFRLDGATPEVTEGTVISVTPESGSIPVYFDYSRPWSRFIGMERETGYPRSLTREDPRTDHAPASTLAEVISKDGAEPGGDVRANRWHSPTGLSRSQQRLIEKELVRSRTILNLECLPPYRDRVLGELIFLTGELRDGASSERVLSALHNECQVSPFLVAGDGRRLMLLALGQLGASSSVRSKVPRAAGHVADTLDAALKNLRMTIERVDSVRKLVEHRYDRLLPSPRSTS
jgi:hypothetical protein